MEPNNDIMAAILDWLARTGWPTEEDDMAAADTCYMAWLHETDAQWTASGRRDRELLYSRLLAVLTERHGHVDAAHIVALLMLHLEFRARGDRDNRRCSGAH